jgi:ribosomal protein S18 acetylase RimI-like enzyme
VPIRDAGPDDLPRLIALLDQLSLDGPREDVAHPEAYRSVFEAVLADPKQRILLLEDEGRLLGSVTLIIVPNLTHNGAPWAQVENVVVEADERGAGHGEALMRHAIEAAREAGCYKLVLTSSKRRSDAHRFYRRLGFEVTHEAFRYDLGA